MPTARTSTRRAARPVRRVSVVTVCLNARDTIEETLDSVRAQRFPAVDHVLIDGGSTDGTAEIIAARQPAHFVSEPDAGLYHAMQKGALAARGDVVFFLNAGDVFHDPRVVEDVVACFDATGADAVFGNLLPVYRAPGDSHDHGAFVAGRPLDLSYFCNRRLFHDESVHHQTMFYRREIFERCGFLADDPRAHGEYHLNMCAFVGCGRPVKHLPRTICRFALGGRSTSDFAAEWQRFATARALLRARYFPDGPKVPIDDPYEYLVEPPGAALRLKIALRASPLRPLLSRAARLARRLARPPR